MSRLGYSRLIDYIVQNSPEHTRAPESYYPVLQAQVAGVPESALYCEAEHEVQVVDAPEHVRQFVEQAGEWSLKTQ